MLYREILTDACDKMKVNYNNKSSVETIEMNLLMKIPEKSLEKMTPDQLKTVAEELQTGYSNPTPELLTMAIRAGIKHPGLRPIRWHLLSQMVWRKPC